MGRISSWKDDILNISGQSNNNLDIHKSGMFLKLKTEIYKGVVTERLVQIFLFSLHPMTPWQTMKLICYPKLASGFKLALLKGFVLDLHQTSDLSRVPDSCRYCHVNWWTTAVCDFISGERGKNKLTFQE